MSYMRSTLANRDPKFIKEKQLASSVNKVLARGDMSIKNGSYH